MAFDRGILLHGMTPVIVISENMFVKVPKKLPCIVRKLRSKVHWIGSNHWDGDGRRVVRSQVRIRCSIVVLPQSKKH